jgi:hypothetical protein
MNFIKKIYDKKTDDSVHLQFQKFSKGEFKNKAIIKAKNSGKKYTIVTSPEFANEFVRIVAQKLGENKTNVKGAIVSTLDLTGEIEFIDKKQFQGVKRYLIEKEMSGKNIIELLEKFPKVFFALTFSSDDTQLKIKPKAPKSGKPGKGNEKPKPDFCRITTTDEEIAKSFIFEKPNFKNALIIHDFIIEDIIIPKEETDLAKIRELAKRKGKIIRTAEIDEQILKEEIKFEV